VSGHGAQLLHNHQAVLDRFVAACQADDRVLAAFVGGSYARAEADEFSDLDLYLITTDEHFDDFCARRFDFVQQLGDPLFIEDFDNPGTVFFILADGTEGELGFGRESQFEDIHGGPFTQLLDKRGILTGVAFPIRAAGSIEQTENLRRQIFWFWHDLSHFITAIGRHDLWWAQGQLEVLRGNCANLLRLRSDFLYPDAGEETYFKLGKAVQAERLIELEPTFCPLDEDNLQESCRIIVGVYKQLAIPLAKEHGIIYPETLERLMIRRFETLRRGSQT
jgi:predicted nucleotidyltransferase